MQVFPACSDIIARAQTLWASERDLLLQDPGLDLQYEVVVV